MSGVNRIDGIVLPAIVTPQLIDHIRSTYRLPWEGLHGWDHWVRVWEIGSRLAQKNGANIDVVALFAFTHDMARDNEGGDYKHGPEASRRILSELQGKFFELPAHDLDLLTEAVELHTAGHTEAHLTVQTCWDSDRLDLGRAGIIPHPSRLCTPEARDPAMLEWAYKRSVAWRSERDRKRNNSH